MRRSLLSMKKLFSWCKDNILFLFTLFLLAFIPLYPKIPLVDIKHVWVYVRVEDFVVLFMLVSWLAVVVRRKLLLQTPLTTPILLFWLIGAIATLHGILLVFPGLPDAFPNVAFLSYVRRIEYMSVFFLAYTSIRQKRVFPYLISLVILTLVAVTLYGLGQKYFSFPAFLTMNEEFAKGIPIQLSALSRISSTFAGHYDLAAYFVLIIPIVVSLVFGYRNWLIKVLLVGIAGAAGLVLFMTVSRISLFALVIALGLVLFMQKKKLVLISIPIMAIAALLLISFSPSLLDRYGSTIKQVDIVVDAKTGQPIAHVKEVPKSYFENKVVKQEFFRSLLESNTSSPAASVIVPYVLVPEHAVLFTEPAAPTGEDLPSGTGYINLSLSPVKNRMGEFYYERRPDPKTGVVEVTMINGDYLHKKVAAYDLSFTTRFQGEWPRALSAFKRNVFFGSGYGSVSLAVDNSYLRTLGEVGAVGFLSFLAIFIAMGVYIHRAMPAIDSRPVKSFIYGLIGGIAGLAVNAIFIDVFEASKIAFLLWLLVGAAVGLAHLYEKHLSFHSSAELRKAATSSPAIIAYLLVFAILLFSPMVRNYFVGDDFTWFHWVQGNHNILEYFISANGFFYRPGAKVYFLFMYSVFWLNQGAYHMVSLFLHFAVSALVFLFTKKIFRNTVLSALAGFSFLIVSGASEAVFWISATGFLFTAFFSLLSLLSYAAWVESKKTLYLIGALSLSVFSMLFHELGIVTPLLFLVYQLAVVGHMSLKKMLDDGYHRLLLLPIPMYLGIRYAAQSHWLSGDYNYNLFKLPFNAIGNALGYVSLALLGPLSAPVYQVLRGLLRTNWLVAGAITIVMTFVGVIVYKKIVKIVEKDERKILLFGALFSLVALLPFLGLGNISSRYGYFASVGIIFLFVYAIKKFYVYISYNGRGVALTGTTLAVGLFFLFHVVQLQQVHSDWFEAGETSRRFFVSIQGLYDKRMATDPLELHFANVPIRHGDAWVFPVGIQDGLWFIFGNPNLKTYIHPTLEQALAASTNCSTIQRVYVVDGEGRVAQIEIRCTQ